MAMRSPASTTAASSPHSMFEAASGFVPLPQVAQQADGVRMADYHSDHLGTSQLPTNDAGQIASLLSPPPFKLANRHSWRHFARLACTPVRTTAMMTP
ncbi:hypothetical protein [Chitinolyticbacter albus]|uniref:hypothetical protein n=1 Tax=Chitinolyticbacter albus TaxID=2961951 RepID=UPI00210B578B|nr:hypothetical protein [Chitinolyticbacter albus]